MKIYSTVYESPFPEEVKTFIFYQENLFKRIYEAKTLDEILDVEILDGTLLNSIIAFGNQIGVITTEQEIKSLLPYDIKSKLLQLRVYEQLSYLEIKPTIHKVGENSFIMASIRDSHQTKSFGSFNYGGVFLFLDGRFGKRVIFQGITKYVVPYIFTTIFPNTDIPKLNSLLIPVVEEIAKKNSVTRLWVNPLFNQGKILEKHYGFIKNYPYYYKDI